MTAPPSEAVVIAAHIDHVNWIWERARCRFFTDGEWAFVRENWQLTLGWGLKGQDD